MSTQSGRITDAELDRLRGRIGQVIEVSERPYLTEANRDAIVRWANATGDRNPLYLDEEYARSTVLGSLIGPPCMAYAFSRQSIGYRGGLPGVHSMFGGSHWKWFRPLPVDSRVASQTKFTDLIELQGRFAGRMLKQVSTTSFTVIGEDAPFAEVQGWGMRMEREAARGTGKYNGTRLAHYSEDEIRSISRELADETLTGRAWLYWEDRIPGEEIPTIIRGPYTPTIAVAFEQAWGGLFVRAHGAWFDFLRDHPAIGILNANGVPEPPEAVHWDSQLARSVGVPDAYDYGPERISWLATSLTNWIGDCGFLEELYCEIRGFNLVGDLTRCHGVVSECIAPSAGDDWGKLRLNIWCTNQRGDSTASGWAIVRLRRHPAAVGAAAGAHDSQARQSQA
jgi:acyl dehydratase